MTSFPAVAAIVLCAGVLAAARTANRQVSGSCRTDDECFNGVCGHDGICICIGDAWVGEHCNVLEWTTHSCVTFVSCLLGTCHEANGRATCRCDDGWTGFTCDIHDTSAGNSNTGSQVHGQTSSGTDPYCGHQDIANGVCHFHPTNGYYQCKCFIDWTGQCCDQSTDQSHTGGHVQTDWCGQHCIHGVCKYHVDEYGQESHHQCTCSSGWRGDICDQAITSTNTVSCVNAISDCHYYQSNTCTSYRNWAWNNCRQYCGLCNSCGGHLDCIHGVCHSKTDTYGYEHYHCTCHNGWEGVSCDQELTTSTSEATSTMTTTTTTTAVTPQPTLAPVVTTPSTTTLPPATATSPPRSTTTALPPATATSPPPSKTTTIMETSTTPYFYNHCQKFATINDLAMLTIASSNAASVCQGSGTRQSPEAFVLNHCNTSIPSQWKPGKQVMASCNDIPAYTPIATFGNGLYSSVGGMAGVFIECLSTGFKIAWQQCDQVPTIQHIDQGGLYTANPDVYYTIQ